jgi:hypothetical protein
MDKPRLRTRARSGNSKHNVDTMPSTLSGSTRPTLVASGRLRGRYHPPQPTNRQIGHRCRTRCSASMTENVFFIQDLRAFRRSSDFCCELSPGQPPAVADTCPFEAGSPAANPVIRRLLASCPTPPEGTIVAPPPTTNVCPGTPRGGVRRQKQCRGGNVVGQAQPDVGGDPVFARLPWAAQLTENATRLENRPPDASVPWPVLTVPAAYGTHETGRSR